ncbi:MULTISPECIES: hypothetical protein [Micromonospora]|uniref:hypothetical protein n=1 Tax=Micromonospora TaxID=1873 RepID=UPI0006907F45|nr:MULTISPECIES: hypothetical protein [Micromonospora]MBC8989779.1 hypothetical protein [Micromonospora chalcea]MBQ1062622.1 hypothetical protein [Micromonospora sp. C41]MCK1804744.1 hypothetical protein [Micromonospora sp. R42106]MCK1832331.1 hypothetical protein [Micromonospora sp. R42003]MCK1843734.1 hypothetical protein [Micromonospora sp. R42004]
MSRVWTAVDIEDIARSDGPREVLLGPGDLISPHAQDIAQGLGIDVRRGSAAPAPAAPAGAGPGGGEPQGGCDDADGCSCGCEAAEEAERTIRTIAAAVVSANPDADASTVATETLRALGAYGGPGVGSPEQAQPLPGQLLPKKAKGARPQFFAEPGMEALVSTMVTLTSEVWVLRERVMTLEQLLADRRVVEGGAVDGFTLSAEDAETRDAEAAAFVARVLRVFYEWREEIVREETPESYREVIRRAFAQVGEDK